MPLAAHLRSVDVVCGEMEAFEAVGDQVREPSGPPLSVEGATRLWRLRCIGLAGCGGDRPNERVVNCYPGAE